MYSIRDARFLRLGYSGDENFAEVEVHGEGMVDRWIVTFRQTGEDTLEICRIVANEAEHQLDWYENNLHTAFPEVQNLSRPETNVFAKNILSFGNLQQTIEDAFLYGTQ
jgi:hypothetical protein